MKMRTYSLDFKICIIKELLKQTMERQNIYLRNPDSYDNGYWNWEQSERCALLTVLDILGDDLSCIAEETISDAHNLMETLKIRNCEVMINGNKYVKRRIARIMGKTGKR